MTLTMTVATWIGSLIALALTVSAQPSPDGKLSCYDCVSSNYQRDDKTCMENSFNKDAVVSLDGCLCCRKAVIVLSAPPLSTVQRQCVRSNSSYCEHQPDKHNYICTENNCNGATSPLRHRGALAVTAVVTSFAAYTILMSLARRCLV